MQSCIGCCYLAAKPDGAGGGLYFCWKDKHPVVNVSELGGRVIGEWGHWTDDRDIPKRCEDYEKGKSKVFKRKAGDAQ